MNSHFELDSKDEPAAKYADPDSLAAGWTFESTRSPGEIVLPYQAPLPANASLFSTWQFSKNKWWLFAFGGGWLLTGTISYFGLLFVGCWLHEWTKIFLPLVLAGFMNDPSPHWGPFWSGALSCFCWLTLVLTMLAATTVLIYFLFVFVGLRWFYGKDCLRTIMGPTELGLSSSGIKIAWRMGLLSFYGPMVSWRDVTGLDCIPSKFGSASDPELIFRFNRNGAEANFVIDPKGFLTDTERSIFFRTVELCVPRSVIDARALSIILGTKPDASIVDDAQELSQSELEDIDLNEAIASIEDKQSNQSEPIQQSIKLKKSSKQLS